MSFSDVDEWRTVEVGEETFALPVQPWRDRQFGGPLT